LADIDLDVLAEGYQLRPISRRAVARAASVARRCLDPILDVGGGPGNHSAVWAELGRLAVLIDVSPAMIEAASRRPNVRVVLGDAERLPFQSDQFGLAYFHMSIHYGDWRRSLAEAARVVRPGGLVDVWTFDPADISSSSLGRWFPSIRQIDEPRFPDPVDLATHVGALVSSVSIATVVEPIERTAASWIEAVRGRFVSSLQFVPDEEIELGIGAFRAMYPSDDDIYRYESVFTRVTCVV
jgi:SAM-dependent methyltransferase